MEHFSYTTFGTCSRQIDFDIDGDKIYNVSFLGGCDGNLKAISKLVEGKTVSEITSTLGGNTCGGKATSCADQLSLACQAAFEKFNN